MSKPEFDRLFDKSKPKVAPYDPEPGRVGLDRSKAMFPRANHQPDWVCSDCGLKFGDKLPTLATFHTGECGVCGDKVAVTEPRDYGYLDIRWYPRTVKKPDSIPEKKPDSIPEKNNSEAVDYYKDWNVWHP